jgi:hypothetical protein
MEKLWNLDDLKNKIEEFKENIFEDESIDDIIKQLQSFYNSYNIIGLNVGNILIFRVRKLEFNEEHNNINCLWAPPPECVDKIGRSNDISESLFYAAFDPLTSILEARITEGDEFSIAVYLLDQKDDWDLSSVVIQTPKSNILEKSELKEYSIMLSKFMVDEFTKEVEKGQEYLYKKSCAISKILLQLPYKDSIVYPSIQNKNKTNIVMTEEKAKDRIKLKSVLKCKLIKIKENNIAEVEIISIANVNHLIDTLEYEPSPIDNFKMDITHDTWVKKNMNFSETFSHEIYHHQKR